MPTAQYDKNVFINCPFDDEYEPILQAVLFCLVRFGLKPRLATERSDAGESRLSKIKELIESSKYSIHDLSRCQAKAVGEHYRLNMPFELGLDFGCKYYFSGQHSEKVILILEEERFRYQAALSDIAGSDIESHSGQFQIAIRKVRNWIVGIGGFENIGASKVHGEYIDFQEWYYEKKLNMGFSEEDIQDYPTSELLGAMHDWVALGNSL